jgi:hypothetical protein
LARLPRDGKREGGQEGISGFQIFPRR